MATGQFSIADYVVFVITLILSVVIGLIPAWKARHRQSEDQYLFANRNLSVVPVALSMLVTYVSGITLLGVGTETYFFGVQFSFWVFGQITGVVSTCLLYMPLIYPLKLTSSNEYLEMRFNSPVLKYAGTILQLLDMLTVGGFIMLGTAFFVETAAKIPIWASMILVGVVSALYTCLGGLQSVIWSDVFQAVVIGIGLIVVLITGSVRTGSVKRLWELYADGGRLSVQFVPSPWNRVDFWSVGLLQGIMWSFSYGIYQSGVQRYTAMPTYNQAVRAMILLIPMNIVMLALCSMMGIIAYGYFAARGCDPYAGGLINNMNQIIPYLVTEVMPFAGLPGLFFAAIFAGALSSMSSFFMAMATFTWQDLFGRRLNHLPEHRRIWITKALVLFYGALSTAMGVLLSEVGGTLIQMATRLHMVFAVPLGVMFLLGAAWPRSNTKSALLGAIVAGGFLAWLAAGANMYKANIQPLPSRTHNCLRVNTTLTPGVTHVNLFNSTLLDTAHPAVTEGFEVSKQYPNSTDGWTPLQALYSISYLWYGLLGLVPGVTVGLFVSFLPGFSNKDKVDERYIFPILRHFWRHHLFTNYESDKLESKRDENAIHQILCKESVM